MHSDYQSFVTVEFKQSDVNEKCMMIYRFIDRCLFIFSPKICLHRRDFVRGEIYLFQYRFIKLMEIEYKVFAVWY